MPKRQPWFEREFPSGLPAHLLPVVIERLRGTPARLTDRLAEASHDLLTWLQAGTWSIQENVGHLLDLEPLWRQRLAELAAQRPELSAADLENRRTHEANHNAAQLTTLLHEFRRQRSDFVAQAETFPDCAVAHTAWHPRLKSQLNIVDLAFFVAEHDDYHLARITELLGESSRELRSTGRGSEGLS